MKAEIVHTPDVENFLERRSAQANIESALVPAHVFVVTFAAPSVTQGLAVLGAVVEKVAFHPAELVAFAAFMA